MEEKIEENKKSYYAIIPANVRYDKRLTPNAKLLYGEITALCNEKGFCWATNGYFTKLYGVSKQSVSSWVKSLADAGYIKVDIERDPNTKEILHRYIRIIEYPIKENLNTPIKENLKENNTNKNNTNNKKVSVKSEIEKIEEPKLREAVENFVQMRKEIKSPITANGLKLAMSKLKHMSSSLDGQVAILNQSTMNSWKGLFELKNDTKGGSGSGEPLKVKTIYEELNNHYKIW